MKTLARFTPAMLVIVLLPLLFGCGGTTTPVNPPHQQVTVAIAEDSISLGAAESYQFTATVTGHPNTNLTWGLSGCTGGACGTLSATGLYTAPATISTGAVVTVTATSLADPTSFDTVAVYHMPIAVSIAPVGAWVNPGRTLQLTAAVRYDHNNAGVTWTLNPACSATCGTLSNLAQKSVTYTAPATVPTPDTVTLTATSVTDPGKSVTVFVTVSVAGGLTTGDYAFSFNGWEILYTPQGFYTPAPVAAAGHFYADASGNISGIEDINSSSGVSRSLPFTGTYAVGSDHRGNFTIVTTQGTATYHMTVDALGSKGKFIKFDALPSKAPVSGTGYFELQDKTAFSLSALAGPYALGMSGTVNANRLAAVGRFSAGPSGSFSSGKMDLTLQTHIGASAQINSTNLALAGSFGPVSSSTGRGMAALTLSPALNGVPNLNFVYYVISSDRVLLVQTDAQRSTVPVLSGELRRQNGSFSNASFDAPTIFRVAGVNRANYGAEIVNAAIGQMVPDGSGFITGTIDDNVYQGARNQAFTGSYSVAPDGRSTIDLQLKPGNASRHIAYFFDQNEAFLMQTSGTDVLFGSLKPQASAPFTVASVSGPFLTSTAAPTSEQAENDSGLTTFDGVGAIASTMDVNSSSTHDLQNWLHHFAFNGSYTLAASGRGTLAFSAPSTGSAIFWLVSPTELVALGKIDTTSPWSVLLEYEK